MKKEVIFLAAMVAAGCFADIFGSGANQFTIDFVNIGNAGNAADSTGYGAVGYDYRIGKYEVTIDQFAKARAADSRIGDGDEGYWNDGTRTVGAGAPASNVSWYEAAKFCNWLTTGDAHTGAYQFDSGGTLTAADRSAAVAAYGTVYVLPTENEWYKAAYYKPINDGSYSLYASGLDTIPTKGTANGWNYNYANPSPNRMWVTGFGAEEQHGTYDMMGNVWEWNENDFDGNLEYMDKFRVVRGGSSGEREESLRSSNRYYRFPPAVDDNKPANEINIIGFRVAAIPEPSSIGLMAMASGIAVFVRRRFRR